MKNAHIPSIGKHPNNIVFFTCDTHGVLPPIAKLTPEQALYHYLSGYTCKINEKDKNNCIKAPQIKFESCFGE
jgi:phosphoenolpyruvate carboxykinase (ATP)